MNIRKMILFSTAMLATAACQVAVEDGENQAANSVETNSSQAAAEPQQDIWEKPQAIASARELAAASASEEERQQARRQGLGEYENLRVVVDISDRQLRLFKGDTQLRSHPVAVGTEEWPTPTGEWAFRRVDINPEWNPPKSEQWAQDASAKAPGDPENPMGRARLVYRMPNTVHGTDDLDSLGKASSHGSIRVANEVVISLAEIFLKAGNSWEGQQWFDKMIGNRTKEYQVPLSNHVPITVQE